MERREIKFREWDGYEMNYYPRLSCFCSEDLVGLGCNLNSELKNFTLMQYTGLKDKNGKEIYERDIVEWDDDSNGRWRRRCQIEYTPAHYRLVGYHYDISKPEIHNPIDFNFGVFIYERDGELEVIGNIYENPELLNNN